MLGTSIGHAVRNAPIGGVEYRFDVWCIRLDVRRHHDDVGRFERRIFGEESEQAVVQHLHLAHRAVAGMDLHRAIVLRDRQRRRSIAEIEDVGLECREQRALAGLDEAWHLTGALDLVQQIEKIAALLAERGEQAVPYVEQRCTLRAVERLPCDVTGGTNVSPVFAAGIL
jgi:hypothetical protein